MKKLFATSAAAIALTAGLSAPTQADDLGISLNAGFVTDYVFRGNQLSGAGAYGGVDFEVAGFYVGAWAIQDHGNDDGPAFGSTGLEVDGYLGYGLELENSFNFNVGYNNYSYTYSSDREDEVGGSIGFYGFAVSYYYGWDHDYRPGNSKDLVVEYQYYDVSWSGEYFGALIGHYNLEGDTVAPEADNAIDEKSYSYFELSTGGEVATLDVSVTYGRKFGIKTLSGDDGNDTGTDYFLLDVSKSFSF
ncbi:Uncharacterised protein [BD1-7 clade bacterium]|uniref:Uncharacterized protein n=1 Tax=BD1-7 clade bacterium TaxID=2029982 RepID=A0A5S9MW18_9GAMM|nr:Uncharacterised protein [BD1-7 clade bacterium]CAA0083264.1 Uncharacterised protein [BD1-7 clade bacterium]